ncbi:ribonuclease III [Bifidobacterium aemilianum]|uniref:Ribonuclease 3 n=1 Tax=Bifidobacterium aemilianum TaxID=2493120 RepID=A0A366K6P9_9BIFI|nr:ribonuclease III [Bifidobacterium aemilianum]
MTDKKTSAAKAATAATAKTEATPSTDSAALANAAPGDPTKQLLEALGADLEPNLLIQALTHRSFSNEHQGALNYERLEFLGDAVLELVTTETLYKSHPDMSEGQLAKIRAKAVSEESLAGVAKSKLHVGPYILLGKGERKTGGSQKDSILCDIFESLLGAVFVQHGITKARAVVHKLLDETLEEVASEGPELDWKTALVVKAREMGLGEVEYRMSVSGPEFAQVFTAEVLLGGKTEAIAKGEGSSKRKAQLNAAAYCWKKIKSFEDKSPKPIKKTRKAPKNTTISADQLQAAAAGWKSIDWENSYKPEEPGEESAVTAAVEDKPAKEVREETEEEKALTKQRLAEIQEKSKKNLQAQMAVAAAARKRSEERKKQTATAGPAAKTDDAAASAGEAGTISAVGSPTESTAASETDQANQA